MRSQVALALSALMASAVVACAQSSSQSSKAPTIGVTPYSEWGEDEEASAKALGGAKGTAEGEVDDEPAAEENAETIDERAARIDAERQDALAAQAVAAVASPNNDLGIVFAVAERASDLPWLLAIENRGDGPVRVAALPELLSFEVVPPTPEGEEDRTAASKGKKSKDLEPVRCGKQDGPKTLSSQNELELAPGEVLSHPFDPRVLCNDPRVLVEGAKIIPRYGWKTATKRLWRKGKTVDVDIEQKAPYAARPASDSSSEPSSAIDASPADGDTPTDGGSATADTPPLELELKHLLAEEFVLGSTYPLEDVEARPSVAASSDGRFVADGDASASEAMDENGSSSEESGGTSGDSAGGSEEPPPVFTIALAPLGSSSAPTKRTVSLTVKNVSGETQRLFVRRELITYEVNGPYGSSSCRMHPADRAPDSSQFSVMAPGASRSRTTRLAEACPQGTFGVPGTYAVSARFDARDDGQRHGMSAYVGTFMTSEPVRFVVKGDQKKQPSAGMRISKR